MSGVTFFQGPFLVVQFSYKLCWCTSNMYFPLLPPTPKTISDLCCEGVGFLLSVHLKTKCSELPIYACLWFTSIPRALWTGACAVPLWRWYQQKQQHFRGGRENPLEWAVVGLVCELPFCFYIVSVHAQLWLSMILQRAAMILVLPRLTTHTKGCTHAREKHAHMCVLAHATSIVLWAAVKRWCSLFPPSDPHFIVWQACACVGAQQLLFC